MRTSALRWRVPLAAAGLMASTLVAAPPAAAYSTSLTRAPYLTDLTTSSVQVNFGTTTSIAKVRLRYGKAASGGSCTASSTTSSSTGKQTYTVTYASGTAQGNQWKMQLSGLSSGTYCYRLEGATSSTATAYTDLLGTSVPSPKFSTGPSSAFAVIGDWGQSGPNGALNTYQANIISRMKNSGAGFAMSTGDIGYESGSQTNYGDLLHGGSGVSEVFGPQYWPVAGPTMPMLPVPGNHGYTTTFTTLWPSTSLASASNGRATNGKYTINGSTYSFPDYWYAFDNHGWRIYVLTAAWGATFSSGSSALAEDYRQHWAPGAAERTWLTNDLKAHRSTPKIAVFHYPLYSAVSVGDVQDNYLTAPPDGSQSVESLLASNNVKLALNGHSHVYERNATHNGLTSVVTGGGGAGLSTVSPASSAACTQTYKDTGQRVVVKAVGWSSTGGSACNTAKPASAANVYNFLLVRLSSGSAAVTAIDSTGATIDSFSVS